ncbi:MAG: response regulator transcription factor [Anaerolineae bacterium]|nr:response regulator transcription factor [Anaerolineae bacterium]
MRLLLVEDEEGIAKFISQGLREAGHRVDWAKDGEKGLEYALDAEYDVMVLDIMLPKMDGLQLILELRKRDVKTPILILTARDSVEDRVTGLNTGADDYLTKPFDFSELLARINALLRRPPLQTTNILRVADLEVDTARRIVRRGGRVLELSQREFMLLEYLMRNAGHVLTRTQIGERVWGFDFYNESNAVDVYIGYLRRKIDKDAETPLIKTVRGVGYRLSADEQDD